MAKIYETPLDVERDALAEEALKARTAANAYFDSGIIGSLIATGSQTTERLMQVESAVTRQAPPSFFSGLNKMLFWVGLVTGVVGFVHWFNKRNEAAHAEGKLQALGPENTVYPPMADMVEAAQGTYRDRIKQEVASEHTRRL